MGQVYRVRGQIGKLKTYVANIAMKLWGMICCRIEKQINIPTISEINQNIKNASERNIKDSIKNI